MEACDNLIGVDGISVKQKWEDLDIECVGEPVTKYWVNNRFVGCG